jgi:hypothetical protein
MPADARATTSGMLATDPTVASGTTARWRMRHVLVAFVVVIVLPIWTFGGVVAWRFATVQRETLEASAVTMARGLVESVDFRLRSIETAITSLSLSGALRSNDLENFYREAQAVARTQRGVIALVSDRGAQILNTNAPFGQLLPLAMPQTPFRQAIETRQAQVSSIFSAM